MSGCKETLLRYAWFIPVVWAINNGYRSRKEIAESLGVSRKLVSSILYYMRRTRLISQNGMLDASCNSIKIWRKGRWFSCIIGRMVVVVHLKKKKVTYYTIPVEVLRMVAETGSCDEKRLCNRINKALVILGRKGFKDAGTPSKGTGSEGHGHLPSGLMV